MVAPAPNETQSDKKPKDAVPVHPLGLPAAPVRLGEYLLWAMGAAVVYATVGLLNEGFYQQDEAAHYLDMQAFWYDPGRIVHNWNKFGYKLLTVLPALGGRTVLVVFHALLAGLAVAMTGRLAHTAGVSRPRLAMILVATQTFFVQLAFRNYAEIPSALLLLLALDLHLRSRWLWAGLTVGALLLFRQEFYPLAALYGVYMLLNRRWVAGLVIAFGPLLHHVAGWGATGDPLFLLNEVLGMNAKLSDAYPRKGFWHYFRMSEAMFGALTLVGLFAWLGTLVGGEKRRERLVRAVPLLVPAVGYFLLHCLFNAQAFQFGPSTGGNLRYLVAVSPLLAVLAADGYARVHAGEAKGWALGFVGAWVLVLGLFLTYEDNLLVFRDVRDLNPLWHTGMAVIVLVGPLTWRFQTTVLGMVAAYCLYQALVLPPLSQEDRMMRRVAAWGKMLPPETPIFATHALFYYFQDRPAVALPGARTRITKEAVLAAPPGTQILYDSHYSYRPQLDTAAVALDWFRQRDSAFVLVRTEVTADRQFQVWHIEKR